MAMLIRALGEDDAAAYRELRVRALREHPEAFGRTPEEVDPVDAIARRLAENLGPDADFLLGAFDGRALVAASGCHREEGVKHRHIGYIWGVYVAPEARRTGLGRRIFEATVERGRAWPDLEQLWLEVTTVNAAARALYLSCGFQSIAVKTGSLKVGDRYYDEEFMVLHLRGPGVAAG
jgi:ribosomal protein S18 acetylase RimI-like enzyme